LFFRFFVHLFSYLCGKGNAFCIKIKASVSCGCDSDCRLPGRDGARPDKDGARPVSTANRVIPAFAGTARRRPAWMKIYPFSDFLKKNGKKFGVYKTNCNFASRFMIVYSRQMGILNSN
jgi:hypothetical protein